MGRGARSFVVTLLLLVGVGAALGTWELQRRIGALETSARDVDARVDRMVGAAAEMVAVQQAYVVPGQDDNQWRDRFAALAGQLGDDVAAVRPRARSASATAALDAIAENLQSVAAVDARIREHLDLGQELIGADLIFADGRQAIDGLAQRLRSLGVAERGAFERDQAVLARQGWMLLGGAAVLWVVGLILLGRRTPAPQAHAEPAPEPAPAPPPVEEEPSPAPPKAADPSAVRAPLDLAAAADVCTAISRMTATVELPDLLARAASVLDASGVIVWMSAGEELFAVAAHGYHPRVIASLGPISRRADNATAACWRSGEIKTFAGGPMSDGAIVAPMFGPDACIGVLAIEARHGREGDVDARAITAMIAAQLATAVAALPAAAPPATEHAPPEPPAASITP